MIQWKSSGEGERGNIWSTSKRCGVGMKLGANDITVPLPPRFFISPLIFFSHTQQFPFFFNSREINQNSLKIFYLLHERALLGLSASAWVMQTYAGTPRARMNPNTLHILAESPWGTCGSSKYTRIFDVCALCQAHTYTVYTVGKWL